METDPTQDTEAEAIPVTAEIEKQVREAAHAQYSQEEPHSQQTDVEINLIHEDVPFHPYHAPFIPRVGELISCRLEVGKGMLATLWRVTQIEHGVGLDYLGRVDIIVEPADEQTAAHWQRSAARKKAGSE